MRSTPALTGSGAMPPRWRCVAAVSPERPRTRCGTTRCSPGFRDCAFVSGSPVAKAHVALLGTVRYQEVGFAVPEDLYIYGVRDRACEVATTPK